MYILIGVIAAGAFAWLMAGLAYLLLWGAFLGLRWICRAPTRVARSMRLDLARKTESSGLKSLAAGIAICAAVTLALLPLFPD